jgi:PEP-CTERM motif
MSQSKTLKVTMLATFCLGVIAFASGAKARVIYPYDMTLVATVDTIGAYDNRGLDYWNGNPLSPTNHPSAYEDELSAQWNFYINPQATNQLFIVASDVADTNFGYISGEPFSLVALTGFEFALPVRRNKAGPVFSNEYAVPNEFLANGGPGGSNLSIDTTPGWSITSVSGNPGRLNYSITTPDVNNAFTHFTSVYGATRILGGGVFEFTYSPNVNLLRQADCRRLVASASNGEGAYIEEGTLTFAYERGRPNTVPEPSTWAMILLGFTSLSYAGYRRASVA